MDPLQHRSITTAHISYPFKFHHNIFKNTTSQTKQTMNTISETASLIQQGCNLARDLESNLSNLLAKQPETVSKSLDQIMRAFSAAKERLQSSTSSAAQQDPMSSYVHVVQQQQQIDACLQEWLRCNYTQAMEDRYIQTQRFTAEKSSAATPSDIKDSGADKLQGQIHQAMDHVATVVSHEINAVSSSQSRSRRRRDHGEIRKLTVPAPHFGNTEIPPEDGFTWRKYGQKEIMGSTFPRGYYRCTHQKLYNCPAKKQVQRLDNDPLTYEVMYRGDHTCHMSSTAPSILPLSDQIKEETMIEGHSATTQSLGTWLSMDFNARGGGSSGGGHSDDDRLGTTSITTTTRYGKDVEFPVVDLADAMFNSGSSSSNSMDFMFTSSMDSKWESGDKKN
ncbi:WRKY transcription factor 55 [Argentina anserina]|uniref:WRKY transcription factor 55 n=1 Tax=Argentina anserina TaxID=57926 RepID=UPI0021764E41|nr:WRKY transcription factor 55 [Potentilla anserina]